MAGRMVAPMTLKMILLLTENETMVPTPDVGDLVDMAVVAEAAGFYAVMISEHIVLGPSANEMGLAENPRDYALPGNQDPATIWPSQLVLASAVAQATTSLRVILGANISPLHHPLILAKDFGTLDTLSRGRLIVQPTVSWHRDEYDALGVDFTKRGAILDEQLEILTLAWTAGSGNSFSFHGQHFDFGDVWMEPQPFTPGGPPLWFGGSSLHGSLLRRLIRYGSGWNHLGAISDEDMVTLIQALATQGRSLAEIELVGGTRGQFPDPLSCSALEPVLATIPAQVARGFRSICIKPAQFIDELSAFEAFCRQVMEFAATLR